MAPKEQVGLLQNEFITPVYGSNNQIGYDGTYMKDLVSISTKCWIRTRVTVLEFLDMIQMHHILSHKYISNVLPENVNNN